MSNELVMMQDLAQSELEISSETEIQLLSSPLLSSAQLISWSLQALEWLGFVPGALLKVSKRLAENPAVLLYCISTGAAALSQASRPEVNAITRTLPSALQNETNPMLFTSLNYLPVLSRSKRQAESEEVVDGYTTKLGKLVRDKQLVNLADFQEELYQLQDEILTNADQLMNVNSAKYKELKERIEKLLSYRTDLTAVSQKMKDIKELRENLSEIVKVSLPVIQAEIRPVPEAYQAYRVQLDQERDALKKFKSKIAKHQRSLKNLGTRFIAQADSVKTKAEEIKKCTSDYIEKYPLLTVQELNPLQEEVERMMRIAGYSATLDQERKQCSLEVSHLEALQKDINSELEKPKIKTVAWQNSAGNYSAQLQTLLKRTDTFLVPKKDLFAIDEDFGQITLTSCSSVANITSLQTRLCELSNKEDKDSEWPSCYKSEIDWLRGRVDTHISFEKERDKYTVNFASIKTNVSAVPDIESSELNVRTAMRRPDYVKLSGGCQNEFEQLTNGIASLKELRVFTITAKSRLEELGDAKAVSLSVDYLVALKREITAELASSTVKLSEDDKKSLEALLEKIEFFIAANKNVSDWQLRLDKFTSSTDKVELTFLQQEITTAMDKPSHAELSSGYQDAYKHAHSRVKALLSYREFAEDNKDNKKNLASPASLTIDELLRLKQALETFHKANFFYLPQPEQEKVTAWDKALRRVINEKLPGWKELSDQFESIKKFIPDSTEPLSKLQEAIAAVKSNNARLASCHTDLDGMATVVAALKQAKEKLDEYKKELEQLKNNFSMPVKNLLAQIEESTTGSTHYASLHYKTLPDVYKLEFNSIWVQCRDLNVWQSRITRNKKQSDELEKVLDATPLYVLSNLQREIEDLSKEGTANVLSPVYRSELDTRRDYLKTLIAEWHKNDKAQTFNKVLANNSEHLGVILASNNMVTHLAALNALKAGLDATMDGADYQSHAKCSEFEKLKDRVDSLINILSPLQAISDSLTHKLSDVILNEVNSDPIDKELKKLQDDHEKLKNAVEDNSDLSVSDKQRYAEAGSRVKNLIQIRLELRKTDGLIQQEKDQVYNPDSQTALEQSYTTLKQYSSQDSAKHLSAPYVSALQVRLSNLGELVKFKQKIKTIEQHLSNMENDFDFQDSVNPATRDSIAQERRQIRSFFHRGDMPEAYQKEFKRVFDRWSVLTDYRSAIKDYKNKFQYISNANLDSPLFALENLQDEVNDLREDNVIATLPVVDSEQLSKLTAELDEKVNLEKNIEKNKEDSITVKSGIDRVNEVMFNNPNVKTRSLKRMKRELESLLEEDSKKREKRELASSSEAPVQQVMAARHKKELNNQLRIRGFYVNAGEDRDQIRNATEKVEKAIFDDNFSSEVEAVTSKLGEAENKGYYLKISQPWKNLFIDYNNKISFLNDNGAAIINIRSAYESYKANTTLDITAITAEKDLCSKSISKVNTLTGDAEYALPTNYREAFRDCEKQHGALANALKKITEFNNRLETEKNQKTFPASSSELARLQQDILSWHETEHSTVSMFGYCRTRIEELNAEIRDLIEKHGEIVGFSARHEQIKQQDNKVTSAWINGTQKLINDIELFLDPPLSARSGQEGADNTAFDLPQSYQEKSNNILDDLRGKHKRSLGDLEEIHKNSDQKEKELLAELKNNRTDSLQEFISKATSMDAACKEQMQKDTFQHLPPGAQEEKGKQCKEVDNYLEKAKQLEGIIKDAKHIRDYGCADNMDVCIATLDGAKEKLGTFMQDDTGYADLPILLKTIANEFNGNIPILRTTIETIKNSTAELKGIKEEDTQRSLDEQEKFIDDEKTKVTALFVSITENKLTTWYKTEVRSLEQEFNYYLSGITELKGIKVLQNAINAYRFESFGIDDLSKFITAMKGHSATLEARTNGFYQQKYPENSVWYKTQIEKFNSMKMSLDQGVVKIEGFKEFFVEFEDENTVDSSVLDALGQELSEKMELIKTLLGSTQEFEDISIIKRCYQYIQQRLELHYENEQKLNEAQSSTREVENDPEMTTADIKKRMDKTKGYLGEGVSAQGPKRVARSVARVCCDNAPSARYRRSIESQVARQEAVSRLNADLDKYTSEFNDLRQKSSVDITALDNLISKVESLSNASATPPAYQAKFSELLDKVKKAKENNEKIDLAKTKELETFENGMLEKTRKEFGKSCAELKTTERWTKDEICDVIDRVWNEKSFSKIIVEGIKCLSGEGSKIDAFHCLLDKIDASSQPSTKQLTDIKGDIQKLKSDDSANPALKIRWEELLTRTETLLTKATAGHRSKRQVSPSNFFSKPSNLLVTVGTGHERNATQLAKP